MTDELIATFDNVAKITEVLSIMNTKELEAALARIKRIDECIEKYGDIARIIEFAEEMQSKIYQCKTVLTLDEAAQYMGHAKSLLYKWTSCREISHYKPTGKAIFIDRSELDDLLRSNPIYSKKAIERMNMKDKKNKR